MFSQNYSIEVFSIVNDFIAKHSNKQTMVFRSGLLSDESTANRFTPGNANEQIFIEAGFDIAEQNKVWENGNYEEYLIDYSNVEHVIKKYLKKKSSNLYVTFDTLSKEYRIVPKEKTNFLQSLGNKELLSVADSIFNTIFPSIKQLCEFDVYSLSYQNNSVYDMTVRYRRIFKHGIVRYNASSVNVQIDSAGNLIEIFIVWPKFTKISTATENKTVKLSNNVISLLVSEINNGESNDENVTNSLTKAEILGVSFGWFPSDIDGLAKLTPCYSFSTRLSFNDQQKIVKIFDIPVLTKYYPGN